MFKSNVSIALAFIILCPHMSLFIKLSVDNSTTGQILNNITNRLKTHDVNKDVQEYLALEEHQPSTATRLLEVPLINTVENPDLKKSKHSTESKPLDAHQDKSGKYLNDEGGYNVTFEEKAREDSFNLTKASENPYAVLLVSRAGSTVIGLCSGSLLTLEWVLTAAHCVTCKSCYIDNILVYAGGNSLDEIKDNALAQGSQIRESGLFFAHPGYSASYDSDIGLIKVNPKFDVNKTVNTVKISTQPWTYHSYYKCTFTGFGRVYLDKKSNYDAKRKTSQLELKQPCLCSFMMRLLFGEGKVQRYICARAREDYGVCPGDSGGGLVCDGEVKAVAMYMMLISNMATCDISEFSYDGFQCGSANTLSVFEDTCPFLHWINQHVHLFNDSQISPNCMDRGGQQRSSCVCEPLFFALFIKYLYVFLKIR